MRGRSEERSDVTANQDATEPSRRDEASLSGNFRRKHGPVDPLISDLWPAGQGQDTFLLF